MPDFVCSLITDPGEQQSIPPGDSYTVVKFPYGMESLDGHDMHPMTQPDGVTVGSTHVRSGLIWPKHAAWAQVYGLIYWEDGPYTEVRDRFVRDPLGLAGSPDSTCTEDHSKTPGGQYRAKSWGLFVQPGVPLALMVRHNASTSVKLLLAEFKLAYRLDSEVSAP